MMSDLPHTLYNREKKVSEKDVEDAEAKMIEAYKNKQKAREEQSYTVDEVFAGAADNG